MTDDVCTRFRAGGPRPSDPCPDCRHTGLVHPGEYNPDLKCCVLCLLLWSAPEPARPSTDRPTGVDVAGPYPVGTVKMHPVQGTVWVKLGYLSGWQCVDSNAPRPITATSDVTASWPVVGAVPLTPAAAWWDRVRRGGKS